MKYKNIDFNAPIFTIRVLGAILILLRLIVCNFIFGAEAIISAQAEIRHLLYGYNDTRSLIGC